ncbi:MAG: DNA polymerase III subunit delta [Chloroflexi bacterium]|nr:DNA polymerase III subunit delta [Chloroflexota bacterium]
MPAHVIYGDSFLVAQAARRVRRDAGADDLMDSNRHRVVAAQSQPNEVLAICNSLPFLDTARLVEIEGTLATQESSGGRGSAGRGRSASRQSGPRSGWMQLADAIPQLPDSTVLVLIDGEINDNNALLRAFAEHCQVHKQAAPTGTGLSQWIKQTAQTKGASISPPAIQAIAEMVGNDLWTLDRELEKLSLYAAGRDIAESDVRALVPYAQEANIFAAVDSIMDGRPGNALRLLTQLMQEGREPLYIIAMIERQLRLIALARDLTERGVVQPELGRRMGANSDFVVRKALGQARRMSMPEISRKYHRVLESDLAIKQGRLDPAVSLELLVADLAGA